ncbi:MAG: B12-binding domain-containing radical SAM protein [Candidatus Omnitrophica bacterium]|nr:B12-binding domain-containing radical SAM protein [Candidatus Omnitrophota bacterium]
MNVVLVNPRSKKPREIQQKCFPPVNLLYIAAALLREGHVVDVIDANAQGLDNRQVSAAIKALAPQLVGITLLSEIIVPVFKLISEIKAENPSVKIVVGGAHANALPEKVLEEFGQVDFVLQGEAEESFSALCAALSGSIDFNAVRGLWMRVQGRPSNFLACGKIENLDALAHPARHLLKESYERNRYYIILRKERPVDTMITSRGCPFYCRFCSNIAGEYRSRSADNVLEEMVGLYRQGIRSIDIGDANFTFDRDRAVRIFRLIQKEKIRVTLRIKSRSDSLDQEIVQEAKRAGVYLISMGMESGSQEVLDRMGKGTRLGQNIEACNIVMNAGIQLNTGWVIGFPGETVRTIEETARLIIKIAPTTANINALVPYPGTEVYAQAKREGMLVGDWSVYQQDIPWVALPWLKSYAKLAQWVSWVRRKVYFRLPYATFLLRESVTNANGLLAQYAWQEGLRVVRCTRQKEVCR